MDNTLILLIAVSLVLVCVAILLLLTQRELKDEKIIHKNSCLRNENLREDNRHMDKLIKVHTRTIAEHAATQLDLQEKLAASEYLSGERYKIIRKQDDKLTGVRKAMQLS